MNIISEHYKLNIVKIKKIFNGHNRQVSII